jgi:hypothetical protein
MRLVRLHRIRSKIFRARHLARTWVSQGGTSQDIVESFIRLNMFLRHNHLQAGERELDTLIVRLQHRRAVHDGEKSVA